MKWTSILILSVVSAVHCSTIEASLLSFGGSAKSDCGECGSLSNCQPVICRPVHTTIYNYQRRYSNACNSCAEGTASCITDGACCDRTCCAPGGCAPSAQSTCCAPSIAASCSVPTACGSEGCSSSCSCGSGCHNAESCKIIAQLIHKSMVGCYATERRRAIHRLGDHFDCCCHPEIMNAFIYALNDSDERVRAKAADEIGDQVRRNRCICGPPVIRALRCALADCDRNVRREAEASLKLCGFKIADGECIAGCGDGYCPAEPGATSGYSVTSEQLQSVPQQALETAAGQLNDAAPGEQEPPVIPAVTDTAEVPEAAAKAPMADSYEADPSAPAASAPVEDVSSGPAAETGGDLQSFFRSRLPQVSRTSGSLN